MPMAYGLPRRWILLAEQCLNGFQLGILLFLLAAGLTLTFGIMDFVNLAHGTLYMIGAFIGAATALATGSYLIGVLAAVTGSLCIGALIEKVALQTLYTRFSLTN